MRSNELSLEEAFLKLTEPTVPGKKEEDHNGRDY